MKPFFFAIALVLFFTINTYCFATNTVKLYGRVSNVDPEMVAYILQTSTGVRDSVVAQKSSFSFDVQIDAPDIYIIELKLANKFISFPLYLQPAKEPVYLDFDLDEKQELEKIKITGSCLAGEQAEFMNGMYMMSKWEAFLENEMKNAKDTFVSNLLQVHKDDVSIVRSAYHNNWIKNHVNSPYTVAAIYLFMCNIFSFENLDYCYTNILTDAAKKDNPIAGKLSEYIKKRKSSTSLLIGNRMDDFILQDTSGASYSFYDIKQQDYVLLDFWASWCAPCRESTPKINALLKKYKHRNFKVVGISGDTDKEAWKAVIEKDKMNWLHLSDLKGAQEGGFIVRNDIVTYPTYVLISPAGDILLCAGDIQHVAKELESIFKNSQ